MKNNLLSPAANSRMLLRIASLRPDLKALWGEMDACSMLRHCRVVTETIIARQSPDESPSLKQTMLRILVFAIVRRIPKGRQQPKVIREALESQPPLSFEKEMEQLVTVTQSLAVHRGKLSGRHPVFGPMKTKQWGRFAWMHLDHHLRQFGV